VLYVVLVGNTDYLLPPRITMSELLECPECEDESLEYHSGGSRTGRWFTAECQNDECGYSHDDVEIYED
jgi:hypothetical protein